MPVTPIENGDTVTQADIETMHGEVRTVINDVPEENLGRHTFGRQHLPTLTAESAANPGQQYDYKEVTVERTITTIIGTPETGTVASWAQPTEYVLNNSGPGYILRPGKVMALITLEISKWGDGSSSGGSTDNEDRHQAWFVPVYQVNGGAEQFVAKTRRFLFAEDGQGYVLSPSGGVSGKWSGRQHRHIVLMLIIDQSAAVGSWTLNYIKLRAVLCRGGASAAPNSLVIRRGTLTFISVADTT